MDKEYTGIIIEESFDDNRIINQLNVSKIHISGDENPKDRWHLYQVHLMKEEIQLLSEHMIETWYMHFWNGTNVIAVFTGNNVFEFNYDDKSTWNKVLEYGRSVGIPEEQLNFPITGL